MLVRIGLLFSMVFLTGCLFTVDSDRSATASMWSEEQLSSIERGETSQDWVRTRFGDPDKKRIAKEEGVEVWVYESVQRRDTKVGLFLIFSIDVDDEVRKRLSIEFTDGLVSSYWTDSRKV
ncbi:MAG: hypothetical protein R3332_05330 [Pseudohongiellaceae bacterium]|nr:hypothetical protein [Pseudohongiellaceae bacterium]